MSFAFFVVPCKNISPQRAVVRQLTYVTLHTYVTIHTLHYITYIRYNIYITLQSLHYIRYVALPLRMHSFVVCAWVSNFVIVDFWLKASNLLLWLSSWSSLEREGKKGFCPSMLKGTHMPAPIYARVLRLGSILRNSISAEKFSDNFLP
jgi:hypothetical protein